MRRFLTLVCLLCVAIPAGMSVSGCYRNPGENSCNGLGYGTGINDVYSITLKPTSGSLSMAWGQTKQANTPSASTCKNATASVSSYTYGSSNTSVVDINPSTGSMCAGTWNRNTGGGIADYTICTANDPTTTYSSTSGALPYASAYITASASGVTSNSVLVYVHAPVTSMQVASNFSGQCYSQGTNAGVLDVSAYYTNSSGTSTQLCGGTDLPKCSDSVGTLTYAVGTSAVATIDSTTNNITAEMPGTTLITATAAESTSTAGTFSTCPPKSITISSSSSTITKGVTQSLVTTATDTTGTSLTGLSLDYQSTEVEDLSVSSAGAITASYPGTSSIYAICQASTCNPAPTAYIGLYGTGMPISSNAVTLTVPGTASQYVWYGAPGASQYFVPVELLTGSVGSSVKLTYVPNSMVMDKTGTNLYFGSANGMMIYSASTNALSSTATSVPGKVLAVSPDNTYVLINDQSREILYVYSVSGSSVVSSYGGLASSAVFTPDDKTVYIADSAALGGDHTDKLYVYNTTSGWSTYTGAANIPSTNASATCTSTSTNTSACNRSLALTIPSAGAYISGSETVSHTHCPSGTVEGSLLYYPLGDTVANAATDILATLDSSTAGEHVLGAALDASGNVTLSDISVTVPTTACPAKNTSGTTTSYSSTFPTAGDTLTALTTSGTLLGTKPVTGITATNLNQIVVSPSSAYAFLTYSGTVTGNDSLPYYVPASGATGTLSSVTLTDATTHVITGPVAAAFSPDSNILFVSTAGDNMAHYIYFDSSDGKPYDKTQIKVELPACTSSNNGCTYTGTDSTVPATVITVKPRVTT